MSRPEPAPDAGPNSIPLQQSPSAPLGAPSGAPPAQTPAQPGVTPGQTPPAEEPPLSAEELRQRHDNLRAAVREEREKSRRIARDLERAEEERRRQAQNFEALLARVAGQQMAPQQPAQAQPSFGYIDPNAIVADPLQALQQITVAYNAMVREREVAQMTAQQRQQYEYQQRQQAEATQRQYHAATQLLTEAENDFRLDVPDYDAAAEHYAQVRINHLQAMGYDPVTAARAVEFELLQGAQVSAAQGRNPAQAIYEAARAYGYSGVRGTPQPAPAARGGGQPAPPAVDPLAQMRAGMAAAHSASAANGASPTGELDLSAGLQLSGAAFKSWSDNFLRKMKQGR